MVSAIYSSPKPKKHTKLIVSIVLLLAAVGGGGVYAYNAFGLGDTTEATAGAGSQSSTPLAPETATSTETADSEPSAATVALQNTWSGIMAGRQGNVDIAVYDNSTGQTAHYTNTTGTFNTASVMKLSILEELLLQSQSTGQPLTSDQRSEATAMIENSDNDAATALWSQIGESGGLNSFFALVGASSSVAGSDDLWGLSQTTAKDQLAVVNAVAYPGTILTQDSAAIAQGLLSNVESDQAWGVSGGVPDGVTVELKNGWLPESQTNDAYSGTNDWIVNSVGHISGNGVDYTIAVLTQAQPSEAYGIDTVQSLSTATWNALSASV